MVGVVRRSGRNGAMVRSGAIDRRKRELSFASTNVLRQGRKLSDYCDVLAPLGARSFATKTPSDIHFEIDVLERLVSKNNRIALGICA